MVYLPTFTIGFSNQFFVNIPYMDPLGFYLAARTTALVSPLPRSCQEALVEAQKTVMELQGQYVARLI